MKKTIHVSRIIEIDIDDDKAAGLTDLFNQSVHTTSATIDDVANHIALCVNAGLKSVPGLGESGVDGFIATNKGVDVFEVLGRRN